MRSQIKESIQKYEFAYIKKDISAGLGVAAISFPQVMAYALLAGVNPVYGLYTFIVSTIIASFTGRSTYMVVGPTNMVSVTIASSLNALNIVNAGNYMQFIFLLTLMVGLIQIVLGAIKIGNLVHFISQPVIVGLAVGVSLIIITSQLDKLMGLEIPRAGRNVFGNIINMVRYIHTINIYSLLMGLFTILVIIFFKRYLPRLPEYLIAVVSSIFIVYLFNLQNNLEIIGEFESNLPSFNIPFFSFRAISDLFSSAVSIAILAFTQVLSIVKVMEKKTGEEIDINREFIGQGIMNTVCSFFSSFVATGSFTKSFTNLEIGARSRLSEFIAGLSVLIFIILFSDIVSFIPISSLAALVIIVAFKMLDKNEIKQNFLTTRFDAAVFMATLATTILTPRLDYAIYFGVLVSFILVLKNTSNVDYSHIKYKDNGEFSTEEYKDVKEDDYIIINISGSMHFNAAENLKQKLDKTYRKNRIFVIRMRRIENIDITTIQELEKFIDRVQQNGGKVILCGLNNDIYEILDKYGIIDKVDSNNCYVGRGDLFYSTKKAIKQAEIEAEEEKKIDS